MNLALSYIRTILSLPRIQFKSLPWAIHKYRKAFYLDIPKSTFSIPHLRDGILLKPPILFEELLHLLLCALYCPAPLDDHSLPRLYNYNGLPKACGQEAADEATPPAAIPTAFQGLART